MSWRIGLPVAVLGALVGWSFTLPGLSARRTLRLLFGVILVRNVPSVGERIWDWVDRDSPDTEATEDPSQRLLAWLLATDVGSDRRGWLVAIGAILGAILGAVACVHDLSAMQQNRPSVLLPLGGKDGPLVESVLVVFAAFVWGGCVGGMFASAAYRRPVLFALSFAGLLSTCIAAAAARTFETAIALVVFFTTMAAGVALLLAAVIGSDDAPLIDTEGHPQTRRP